MIDHIWTVFCTRSVIDTETNNITLIEIIEQIAVGESQQAGREGVIASSFELVTLWARSHDDRPTRGRARVSFLRPSGEPSRPAHEYDIDLSVYKRTRMRVHVNGLPVNETGRHVFLVELWNEQVAEWQRVAANPLEVSFALVGLPPGS